MPRRNFALLFIIALLLASAATFAVFTYVARTGKAQRREVSRANLIKMHEALQAYARENGRFPDDLSALQPRFLQAEDVIHPAWPERPGYMYVAGVQSVDPPESVLVFENLPERKVKLGRLAVTLQGQVQELNEADFQQRLSAQELRYKEKKRAWTLRPSEALPSVIPR